MSFRLEKTEITQTFTTGETRSWCNRVLSNDLNCDGSPDYIDVETNNPQACTKMEHVAAPDFSSFSAGEGIRRNSTHEVANGGVSWEEQTCTGQRLST